MPSRRAAGESLARPRAVHGHVSHVVNLVLEGGTRGLEEVDRVQRRIWIRTIVVSSRHAKDEEEGAARGSRRGRKIDVDQVARRYRPIERRGFTAGDRLVDAVHGRQFPAKASDLINIEYSR